MRTLVLSLAATLLLAACGAEPSKDAPKAPSAKAADPAPTGPVLSGVGTVAEVSLRTLVIDHEAVEGGLPAGRNTFRLYGDVAAQAPLEPGARVAFNYQDWKPEPVLTEVKAR
ncbi:MAG: copper-binding protein [Phenylobacterium sp.]|uniref:copper-binding protein n=1 Tax=Phenylobacterium sp. TaxID=1871053 RepID=UPI002733153A|nr:copper-binding protein [Phenylobacterium sp.]MDP3174915.1 copper-binding protein [Phenylobacterium sp.]